MRLIGGVAGYSASPMILEPESTAALVRAIQACGFDPRQYLARHNDLQDAGVDEPGCVDHFIHHGYAEARHIPAGPWPAGLAALCRVPGISAQYRNQLLRAIFQGQCRHPGSAEIVWRGIDREIWALCRQAGGLPFVIIGDSHANLYNRFEDTAHGWLAPTLLLCSGGSARGLARENSRSGYCARILAWATASNASRCASPVPVLLKFGQVDAEFVWIFDRVRHGIKHYRRSQFIEFAAASVAEYMRFLQRLRQAMPRASLHVCSLFPPVLSDAAWHDGYVNAHIGFLEGDRALSELRNGIQSLEVPDLAERTALHGAYNALLQSACRRLGVRYCDDFRAILNGRQTVEEMYFSGSQGNDHHLDYDQMSGIITALIAGLLQQPAGKISRLLTFRKRPQF